ncbi:hypothetical protein MPSEU_000341000 [Mayamaea pseudoterrestris]|nr:hypothetical protein MPSEU_000341000 [Mayamaea pseudoterrestris]
MMNNISRTLVSKTLAAAASRRSVLRVTPRYGSSDSITYSGGQASEGQGGFYGSGGARAQVDGVSAPIDHRQLLVALAADVDKITMVMEEIDQLEESLREQEKGNVTSKTMEIKNAIKKRLTSPDVIESLNRLEVEGQPTWGLSTKERELIIEAREKMNES